MLWFDTAEMRILDSQNLKGCAVCRVPYTCHGIAGTALLALRALCGINNFRVFSGAFWFDPHFRHHHYLYLSPPRLSSGIKKTGRDESAAGLSERLKQLQL
jgi:hypothetical protein